MEIRNVLKQLGLTENEIKIYLALLPLGTAPSSLLGARVGLPRTTSRFTCNQLVEKDLISRSQKGRSFIYKIETPDRVLHLLEEEKEELKFKEEQVKRVLGQMKTIFNPAVKLPKVEFYEGVQGLIKLLNDSLKYEGPLYGATKYYEDIPEELKIHHRDIYIPKRIEKKNSSWFIFNDNKASHEYQKKDKEMNRISLLVDEKEFPFESSVQIYGNKVAFYSVNKKDLTGVLIENEIIKETQFSLFKLAWNYARNLKKNKNKKDVEL